MQIKEKEVKIKPGNRRRKLLKGQMAFLLSVFIKCILRGPLKRSLEAELDHVSLPVSEKLEKNPGLQ